MQTSDNFDQDIQVIKKQLNQITKDLQKRNDKILKQQPHQQLDTEIKGDFEKVQKLILTLKESNDVYISNNPTKDSSKIKQQQRQKQELEEIQTQYQKLKASSGLSETSASSGIRTINFGNQRENFAEKNKEATNEQLYQEQRRMLKQQEEHLGAVNEVASDIKKLGIAIGEEVDSQNPLLDSLDHRIDNNIAHIEKARSKVDKLLEQLSHWKLIICIAIELVLLILILVFL